MDDDFSDREHALPRDHLSPSDKPYHLPPGSVSLFRGFNEFFGVETRAQKLARPMRVATINWLVASIIKAAHRSEIQAHEAIIAAIPDGQEDVLDDGEDFVFLIIEAALRLGIDPSSIQLAPEKLDS